MCCMSMFGLEFCMLTGDWKHGCMGEWMDKCVSMGGVVVGLCFGVDGWMEGWINAWINE